MAIKIKGSTIINDNRILENADKIGIGTTNPQVALEIFSGDVGIGTTNPSASNIQSSLQSNTNILAVGIVTANEYYGTFKGTVVPETAADRIEQGNTKAQVVDTDASGPGGHFLVETGGTEKFRITGIGSVGIGTEQPINKLQVGVGTQSFNVTGIGSVGIGARFPSAPLQIYATAPTYLPSNEGLWRFRIDTDVSDGAGFYQRSNGDFEMVLRDASDNVNHIMGTDGALTFTTSGTEKVRITSTGNVGIGTTVPTDPVHSTNNAKLAVGIVTAREYYGTFKGTVDPEVAANRIQQGNTKAEVIDTNSNGYFLVATENQERLRINSDGDVGIGTTNPKKTLHVSTSDNSVARFETTAVTGRLEFKASGSSGIPMLEWKDNDFNIKTTGHLSDPVISIKSGGNIGIGTTNPDAAVTSSNTAKLAVGIVTAREYYGTFKGTIDPIASDNKIEQLTAKAEVLDTNNNDSRFIVSTASSERLKIDYTGLVEIGDRHYSNTYSWDARLKVAIEQDTDLNGNPVDDPSAIHFGESVNGSAHPAINFLRRDGATLWSAHAGQIHYGLDADNNRQMVFATALNAGPGNHSMQNRMVIKESGDVGIGTEIPTNVVNSTNNAKLAVGIVTAREYYGLFKGTIDSTVNSISLDTNIQDIFSVSGNQLSGVDAGSDKIVFWDDTNTGGELTYLTVGNGLEIINAQLNATKSAGKTYTLPLIGTNGGNGVGIVTWTLTDNDSPVATNPVTLKAGSNISISNYNSSEFTIEAVQGAGVGIAASASQVLNVNGGEIGGVDAGTNDKLVYWDSDALSNNGRLDYLTVGTGLEIVSGELKVDSSVVGKSYTLPVTVEGGTSGNGGNSGIATLTLTDDVTPTPGTDPVTIEAGDGIVIESRTDGLKISADISEGGGGGVSDVQVKQYSDNADPRTERLSTNPIDVQKSVGIVTIGIGTTSNAYGNRFVGPNTPSGAIEGDIWYDTTTTGQGTNRIAVLRDEKTAGAYGGKPGSGEYSAYRSAYYPPGPGGSFVVDSWFPRNINTEYDPSNFVSVGIGSTNAFGLEAGSYKISWRVPAHQTDRFQSRLAYNTNSDFSGTTSYYYGTSQYSGGDPNFPSGGNPSDSGDESEGEYIANIPATTYFRIEQWIYSIPYYGTGTDFSESTLGVAINRDSQTNAILNPLAPGHEVYTQVKIEDLATAVKDEGFSNKIQQDDTKAEVIDTGSDGKFVVTTEGVERVIVDPSGYLNARADIRLRRTGTNDGGLYFGDSNNNYIFGSDDDEVLTFATAGSERLRITSNGTVGIGSTIPKTKLDVNGGLTVKALNLDTTGAGDGDLLSNGGSDGIFGIYNTTNSGKTVFPVKDSAGNYNNILELLNDKAIIDGNVGIGTEIPTNPVLLSNNAKLAVGIVTANEYYGSGNGLTGVSTNFISAVGIQSDGLVVGAGITQLNFIGVGNTFLVNGSTVDISIDSGAGGASVNVGSTPPTNPSPSQGDLWYDSEEGDLHVYYNDGNSSQWVSVSSGERIQKVSATGGTTSTVNGYKVHKFTTSGTFDVTASGEVEVLVVAGGGSEGGGSAGCHAGGGGGGGGVVRRKIDVHAGSKYQVIVGAGGPYYSNGGDSRFADGIQALGGGAGGPTLTGNGVNGGSGGGASRHTVTNQGGSSIQASTYGYGMGNNGGNVGNPSTNPGGGGGAGGPGSSGNPQGNSEGGPGYDASDFEVGLYVGAGGNGKGGTNSSAEGRTPNNTSGAANTGAGGGGSQGGANPRSSGGSGVVFVRYIL